MFSNIVVSDDKKSQIYQLKNDQKVNFLVFVGNKKNISLNLKIHLAKNNLVNVYGLDLNDGNNKKYCLEIYHHDQHSTSNIAFLSLAKNRAKSSIFCQTYNAKNKKSNVINQNIKGFVFDDKSSIDALPSLDINNSNVVANHMVNVGQIDPKIIFYLGSKGFSKQEVYSFLINSFKQQIIKQFPQLQKSIIYTINSFWGK